MHELTQWEILLDSGNVTHVRPRQWCGIWQLHAYNRNANIPLLGSIIDSPQAHRAVLSRGISIEDLY